MDLQMVNLKKIVYIALPQQGKSLMKAIAVTSDNNYVVSSFADNSIKIFSIQDRVQNAVLEGHTTYLSFVIFNRDIELVISGSYDNIMRVWEISRKKEVAVLDGHTDKITGIAVTDKSRYLVSTSMDNTTRIWKLKKSYYKPAQT